MLADRVMRGEEGSEFEACHTFLSGRLFFLKGWVPNYGLGRAKAIAENAGEVCCRSHHGYRSCRPGERRDP
jgi:hypothetical protein